MVFVLVLGLAWCIVVCALTLPLSLGRVLASYILSSQVTRVSDFLPLSLGVVAISATVLTVAKVVEVFPAVAARAATVENRRYLHFLAVGTSSSAMVAASLVLAPMGLGTLLLNLVLPLKARSIYHVPTVFLATDCWSLGLVLTKVIWLLVQTDVILHELHAEFAVIQLAAQRSWTDLVFDLQTHGRVWKTLIAPLFEIIAMHLILPQMMAQTFVLFVISEEWEFLRAALLMYCYHIVLGITAWRMIMPIAREWFQRARQQIFDAKYLISTELRNYHQD